MKTCKTCQSPELVPRGSTGFRNQCHGCWAQTQRELWRQNRDARRAVSRANYAKHAPKRREEAAAHKRKHREYYSMAEWFRKKGIPIRHVDPSDIKALAEMKKAINDGKDQMRSNVKLSHEEGGKEQL